MSNASIATFSEAKKTLKNIRISNVNKLISRHLIINSLTNKFDLLCGQIKGLIDIFTILETKLDGSFPQGQFLIEGFHSPIRFDRNKTAYSAGILLYVREDIPANALSHEFPTPESFFIEIILHKKKWLINCSYNPQKNSIKNHLEIINRTLDTFTTKYENIFLMGDFNACADDETMKNFCSSCGLYILIKQPTCYKNPDNRSCIDLILRNKAKSFQSICVMETGLSDFHR